MPDSRELTGNHFFVWLNTAAYVPQVAAAPAGAACSSSVRVCLREIRSITRRPDLVLALKGASFSPFGWRRAEAWRDLVPELRARYRQSTAPKAI